MSDRPPPPTGAAGMTRAEARVYRQYRVVAELRGVVPRDPATWRSGVGSEPKVSHNDAALAFFAERRKNHPTNRVKEVQP